MLQEMDRLRSHFRQMLDKLEKVYVQTNKTFNQITSKWQDNEARLDDDSRFSSLFSSLLQANRVAFSSALVNDSRFKCVGPFTMSKVVPFKHTFLNLGDCYNSTSGIFTVPHTGLYSLALTVYSDAGTPGSKLAACAGLQVNDQVVAGASEKNNLDQEDSSSAAVALHLKAGDQVAIFLPPGCFLCDDSSHFNTFSGFLLYDE